MNNQENSRFITYPSFVDDCHDNSILIIDADVSDIEDVGFFCKSSNLIYDVYLYHHDLYDLEWLSAVIDKCAITLKHEDSQVTITNHDVILFGDNQTYKTPLAYMQKFDGI